MRIKRRNGLVSALLERVLKIISAICKPHFAVYFTLIRLP